MTKTPRKDEFVTIALQEYPGSEKQHLWHGKIIRVDGDDVYIEVLGQAAPLKETIQNLEPLPDDKGWAIRRVGGISVTYK